MLFVVRIKSHIQPKRSCSIEYSSFNPLFICLRVPSLNNVVYVNSVSQVLIMTAQRLPEAEDWFFRVGFRFRFFLNRLCILFQMLNFFLLHKCNKF